MTQRADIIIIGAGMAGASLAWRLAPHAHVMLVEMEDQPGYHTTGRSAAFFEETYGGLAIQPLTSASKAFFLSPPAGFGSGALVRPRGALHVATADRLDAVDAMVAQFSAQVPSVHRVGPDEIAALAPVLRPAFCAGGVHDPECRDIDVAALHAGCLAGAAAHGAQMLTHCPVTAIRRTAGHWQVQAGMHRLEAPVLVNAAGAWADLVAMLAGIAPVGLSPMRRTIITFDPAPIAVDPAMPLVLDIDEQFYFKPDAGQVWASPADETPAVPCDAQPEEIDKATIAARIEEATTLTVRRIARSWAGLRTFAPDRAPVLGFEPGGSGYFWCAGQGGFGIQTAPAASALAASLVLGAPLPADLEQQGVRPARYAPDRFRR